MDKDSDKRIFKRIYRHFVVRFRLMTEGLSKGDSSKWDVVTLNDLSAGGALFNYDRQISLGSLLDMQVTFLWLEHPLEFQAKVLRVQKIPGCSLYQIAVIFVGLDENNKNIINNFAEKFNSKRI